MVHPPLYSSTTLAHSEMPALPDQYNKYCWRVSEADASLYWRYSAGVEKFLDYNHRYQRGEDYMMLGVDLALSHAVSSRDVLHAAGQAWATLRFTVPMIAGTTEITPEDDALLVYRVAPNSAAVEAWAERTVKLTKATTLEEARIEVDQLRPVIPDSQGDQTFLYVGPRGSPTDYAIILYGSHVPFDGVGYQTVMSRYLAILARYISDGKHETQDHSALQWGTEAQNLELPSFQVVSDGEPLEGPVFDNTLSQLNENMATLAVCVTLSVRNKTFDSWRSSTRIPSDPARHLVAQMRHGGLNAPCPRKGQFSWYNGSDRRV
jgi:hypothetical protein